MSNRCDLLGVGVMSGHKVSHSNRKTNRRFLPNLKNISLYSDSLKVDINVKIASSSLRTINKYGNIDSFLVNYRFNKLTPLAQKIRRKIKTSLIKSKTLEEVLIKKVKKVAEIKSAR